uniref:Carboxylic ester hydrolase n=1 Tax=Clastoptera arizonana TaxID=38151 RepID=A0A1B6DY64_9HEMI
MKFEIITLIFVVIKIISAQILPYPEVNIEQGTVRGKYEKTISGKNYAAFVGIPYAQPPVGKNRFKEPKEPDPWFGVYKALESGSPCLQYTHFGYKILGDEDCLFLNIYTPSVPVNKKVSPLLDVLFYIHGGAFMFASGDSFRPGFLLDRDIILVTINYRLGPLGFLSTGDEVIPGNNGLKDQTAALKWVRKNIAAFGGNPDSVTIMGVSAGGASVHYHYLSPLSQGLFKRGLSLSGTALCPWTLMDKGQEKAFQLGSNLGCSTQNSTSLLRCLRKRPAVQIVAQVKEFLGWLYNPYSPFGPTVERGGKTPFLEQDPYQILTSGNFQQVPWITSVTSEEGLYPGAELMTPEYLKELDSNFYEILPHLLDFNLTVKAELKHEICKSIKEYYLNNKDVSKNTVKFIQMISDRLFVSCGEEGAKIHAAKSSAPVYFYYFNYRGEKSISNLFSHSDENFGVSHGDDILYLFDFPDYLDAKQTSQEKEMTERYLNFITSYAKSGVPQFTPDFVFPTVKEALPDLRYIRIKSPHEFIQEQTTDLGNSKFWFKLNLKEEINTSKLVLKAESVFTKEREEL